MGQFFPILVLALASASYLLFRDNFDQNTVVGKRVLVTGASSGIGEELAYYYSQLGASLVLTARRSELLKRVSEQCNKLGAKEVSVIPADMVKSKDRIKVVDHTRKVLGGLDHLIMNHALFKAAAWTASTENITDLQRDIDVIFISYVELASRALPMLIESKGHIGVVSSVSGKVGTQLLSTYCASKFALQGFFSSWRQELIHNETGVSVTIAVLGPILTEAAVAAWKDANSDVFLIKWAESAKDTAEAIVRAVECRNYELYFGLAAKIIVFVHKLIPGYFENYIRYFYENNPF